MLPAAKELWVVEPLSAHTEDPPVKRVMSYPVELRSTVALNPNSGNSSSPDSGGEDGHDSGRQRRRQRLTSPPPPPPPPPSSGGGDAGQGGAGSGDRRPVKDRLVPIASCQLKVASVTECCSNSLSIDDHQEVEQRSTLEAEETNIHSDPTTNASAPGNKALRIESMTPIENTPSVV